ncbi:hypothetical protein [Methylomonas fluvii]|uniref:Uncharacterized protein n=1 Tax=Methylomonas fluvii TaxID=1854564 RepID=A0ABR9DBU4_9GAMM|nr:hypothetical protein [Methylomonas fluvii]MBD9360572.1 hypothetical protein [Methylomonas fluvii]
MSQCEIGKYATPHNIGSNEIAAADYSEHETGLPCLTKSIMSGGISNVRAIYSNYCL